MNKKICLSILLLLLLNTACAGSTPSPTPASAQPWREEEVTFAFGPNELYGILTLPGGEGPHPAVVLISGSADTETGVRNGAQSRYHIEHARKMVLCGFAVLRYDPPGAGRSEGEGSFESLDQRSEEAVAALHYLQSRPDIQSDGVGLWGASQGGWVIAMAAAAFPQDVAFLISVSGSGVSVAEQQVYSIEAQSRAAGLPEDRTRVTYTVQDTQRGLQAWLGSGDTVLVKGAVEARMERVVAGLLSEPDRAAHQLVRQTAGWRKVRLLRPGRPTWLEVDLEAIAHNVRRVVGKIGPDVRLLAVLKADAYGHGAVRVARTALNNGASYLGVASINEGSALRQSGVTAPILVLGFTPAWQARELVLNDLSATIFDLEVAGALSRAARELDRRVRIHVKVDTGMGRLGLLPHQVLPFMRQLRALPHLLLEGIFTHFSVADADPDYTRWQIGRFRQVLADLASLDVEIPLVHAANSAAILTLPESHFSMVRLGLAMYGLHPSDQVRCPPDFRTALAFKTQVAQIKTLAPGSFVSYGNTYQTVAEQRIAVIPVGYADGFRRAPHHWGQVLVRGRRASIVGRVCMDQTMIDVTAIPGVRQGDEVVLIGEQGQERITAEDVAERLGTINYEVVSQILARVPRVV